jgi:methyl-accepting chemotaxis protein
MNSQPKPRKNHFILPGFQGRFIAWTIFAVLLAGTLSALLVYFFLTSDFESEMRSAHVQIEDAWNRLAISIMVGNAVAGLVGAFGASYVVLHRSHKIAGPLYRLQQLCQEVGEGNLEISAHLRDQDQLQELARAFGDMLERLRKARGQRRKATLEINQIMALLKQATGGDEATQQVIAQLEEKLGELTE